MAIKNIKVSNFKSFKDLDIELNKLNVLIGANASGKSNFIQIFKFLRDISKEGLDNAVSMQGGLKYLKNICSDTSEAISLKIVSDQEFAYVAGKDKGFIWLSIPELTYEMALQPKKKESTFTVSKDEITARYEFYGLKIIPEKEKLGSGEVFLSNVDGKLAYDLHAPEAVPISKDDIFPPFLKKGELPSKDTLLQNHFFHIPVFYPRQEKSFTDISIYDFDPKQLNRAMPINGKHQLEEDGSNLAIVLKDILEDDDGHREFSNLIRNLLPFVGDLRIKQFANRYLSLEFQETYSPNLYLPASLMSDGTINIAALIVALYFDENPLIIIEEPERNIHPSLISKVVEMLKDASENKRIIVTTHNPEIIKHVGLDDILLISRNREGISSISRPSENEEVQIFLKNEIGIEELYIQNLLAF